MSRETTVVDPGGGTRGSEPPLSDLTFVQKFLLFFGALLRSVRLCSQRVFPTPMATGVRRQSSLNQDPPIKNSWIRPWTSSL